MKIDRSNPYVWGGQVEEAQSSIGGGEVADPSHGPTEFMRQVEPPPGQVEETVVFLGTMFGDTEAPVVPRGSMGGRVWGAVSSWVGGDD